MHGSTGTLVARDEEIIGSTISMPMFAGRPSTMNSFFACGNSTEFYGWTAKTAVIGASFLLIHHSIIFVLEVKIQEPGDYLFRFSVGGYVMDQ